MTTKQATRRYFIIFIPAMIVYLGGTFGIKWITDHTNWPSVILYGVVAIPIIAALSMFWAHWRYINDVDEFLRMIQIKAMFFALATVMSIATGWGILEAYIGVPRLEILWLNPIFWASYGLSAALITKREGGVY